jgi:type VI secretion system protein VasJ
MLDFFSEITAPVAGDSPFGADVNHDPDYERLKGEMGKLGDIDVSVVEALSRKILAEKSKDARVMAWAAYAALRRNDIGRLADVFCALAYYCQESFERVFPLRESAKAAALRWFSESRFDSRCVRAAPKESDAPHITRLKNALSQIRLALEKRYADAAPSLSPLCRHADSWEKAVKYMLAPSIVDEPPRVPETAAGNKEKRSSGGEKSLRRQK